MQHHEIVILIKVIALCLFLFMLVGVFVFNFIKQSKSHLQQKLNLEIQSREVERLRIAADLHDDIGPLLASVNMHVNSLNITSDAEQEKVKRINQNIYLCIEQVRNISNSLMPSVLQRYGLLKALEEFLKKIESETELKIQFFYTEPFPEISQERSVHIYRIMQEIVTNTLKHAKASTLDIRFILKSNKIMITTEDNGQGFDLQRDAGHGIGLNNIKNRVYLLHGEVKWSTAKNHGLLIHIVIPK